MYFYDLECYRNVFLGIFISSASDPNALEEYIEADKYKDKARKNIALSRLIYKKFVIFHDTEGDRDINELKELREFLFEPELHLTGFNNYEYDDILLLYFTLKYNDYVVQDTETITADLKYMSDEIIMNKRAVLKIHTIFAHTKFHVYSWDVLNSLFETVQRKSLKQLMISIRWHRIEDLPYIPSSIILYEQLYNLSDYCMNDVLGTKGILDKKVDEMLLKIDISAKRGFDATKMNRSKIADTIITKAYSEYVSYTHLTLPTLHPVHISVIPASNTKQKTQTHK